MKVALIALAVIVAAPVRAELIFETTPTIPPPLEIEDLVQGLPNPFGEFIRTMKSIGEEIYYKKYPISLKETTTREVWENVIKWIENLPSSFSTFARSALKRLIQFILAVWHE